MMRLTLLRNWKIIMALALARVTARRYTLAAL